VMKTLRCVAIPVLVTAAITLLRLFGEVDGWIDPRSGGGGFWLGITWLVFLFGAWFGLWLHREGSQPKRRPVWLFALPAMLVIIAAVAWRFGPLLEADRSDATFQRLRESVLMLAVIATSLMALMFFVWPRLALTLLVYGFASRAVVLAVTWYAKDQEWNTHYTKFGPPGLEFDMATTMQSAALAQLGFWVPFTVIAGTLAGGVFARRRG
ncbi:MAG: hypothetical protein AB7I19_10615, partial [Planctomycetota bacterium]